MPLQLIVGPPNSGKAGELMRALGEALPEQPLLVVPTWDDVWRFEEELAGPEGSVVGAEVVTFGGLFQAAGVACGLEARAVAGPVQRAELLRRGVVDCLERGELEAVAASARRPGFVAVLGSAISDLQAALASPGQLADRIRTAGLPPSHPARDLVTLFTAYERQRDRHDLTDRPAREAESAQALRANPCLWRKRPVFVYGFDDLTEAQLLLLEAISAEAELKVAVVWEDRPALAARSRLLERLGERLGGAVGEARKAEPANTNSASLFALEQAFGDPGAEPVEDDGSIRLLEAGGRRAEAELVAAEVARLLREVTADQIAVVLRAPAANALLYAEVFAELGVPAAIDGDVPIARTAVGRGLLAALRASGPDGTAEDVVTLFRARGATNSAFADRFEAAARVKRAASAEAALALHEDWGSWEVEALREARGRGIAATAIRIASSLAEGPLKRAAAIPGPAARLELRAAAEVRAAMDELMLLDGPAPTREALISAIEELVVPLWRGGGGAPRGRVRLLNPYRARARRFSHVIVAGLNDDEFPRRRSPSPFFDEEERARLRLPERAAPEDEERYLFHACLSRPTDGLALSRQTLDDEGRACLPSPFLEEILDLLDGEPPVAERPLGASVFALDEAPSRRELTRSLAATPPERRASVLAELDDREWAAGAADALRAAELRAELATLPGPLRNDAVLDGLREREAYSVTRLESYRSCSYRWFVDKELRPKQIDPEAEQLTLGGAIHRALEMLFEARPGGSAVPTDATASKWQAAGLEFLHQAIDEKGLPGMAPADSPASKASVRRLEANLHRLIEWERTAWETPPDHVLVETGFGPGTEHDGLQLEGFVLEGRPDRIDVWNTAGGPVGLLRDYKNSTSATPGGRLGRDGRLQLQLYSLAMRTVLGIEPLGALYHPLAAKAGEKPRGIVAGDLGAKKLGSPVLRQKALAGPDLIDTLDDHISEARVLAEELVSGIRAGRITRDPLGHTCPRYCTFAPICRLDRASPAAEAAVQAEEARPAAPGDRA